MTYKKIKNISINIDFNKKMTHSDKEIRDKRARNMLKTAARPRLIKKTSFKIHFPKSGKVYHLEEKVYKEFKKYLNRNFKNIKNTLDFTTK